MRVCVCDWVTLPYSRKLMEHCKPTIMEKTKIIKKIKIFPLILRSTPYLPSKYP